MELNKVIIIGNDHVNTLGIIRNFGENGIKPNLIVMSDAKYNAITKSKYINKYWICNKNTNLIELLITTFSDDKTKSVIIPASDEVALLLDIYYEQLKTHFILPNIDDKKGQINTYMDKYHQYQLFQKYDILTAKTKQIQLNDNNFEYNLIEVPFPCIIKPLISANGDKRDISICNTQNELQEKLKILENKNYNNVLIQEFIEYEYEYDICGFSYDKNICIPAIIKKERIWPQKRGSTTYGEIKPINHNEINLQNIIKMLTELNFNGIFDIEIFVKENKVYINEINFRNSAISYGLGSSQVCYYWYLSNIKSKYIEAKKITKAYKIMHDFADIHNIIDKNITIKQYKDDKKAAYIKLIKNQNDPKPEKYMFIYKILNKIINILKKIKIFNVIHFDKKAYILELDTSKITSQKLKKNYKIIEINENNYNYISENIIDNKTYKKIFKKKQNFGLAFEINGELVARGILKSKGSYDYYLNIVNDNSYLISSINVSKKFRGKNYQCDIIQRLINKNNKKNCKIYAVVYVNNYPSLKNFEKLGFKYYDTIKIFRFFKHSINKKQI